MTPERLRRVQQWYDGGGTDAERAEVEGWLADDAEVAEVVRDFELQGELLREAVELRAGEEAPALWDAIASEIRREEPHWAAQRGLRARRQEQRSREASTEAPADRRAGDELPLRGWLLAMMSVAVMLLVVSLLQTGDRSGRGETDSLASAPQDHSLEIESIDVQDGSVMVFQPEERGPAIIWVSYDEDDE
jgi:anti-sigma factor RsiW